MSFVAERHAREERATLIKNTEPLVEKLQRGERLTVEERASLNEQHAKIAELNQEVRDYEAARELASSQAPVVPEARDEVSDTEKRDRAFSAYLRRGDDAVAELRAAGISEGTAGGYTVPPGWWQRLQVALKAFGGTAADFEQLETDSGQPMQWATTDPTSVVGQLVGKQTAPPANTASGSGDGNENAQVQDVDYVFGTATLGAYMYTSGVQKVSFQLANDSAFDIDAFVAARCGEALGRAKALVAISGSGVNEPLGIITALAAVLTGSAGTVGGKISGKGGFVTAASAAGAPTPQTAGGSETEVSANTLAPVTLRSMIAAVDPAYRALGSKFYMNDNQLLGLRGQVDGNGRPLINLQDGLTQGAPTTLWGYPITVDQNIPDLAAGATGGPIFGHLQSAMVLRTVRQSDLMRLVERYADLLEVGFISYMRQDVRSNDLRAAVTVSIPAGT